MRKSVLVLVLLALSVPVVAATLAGVTMPDTMTVGNQTLVLNGMGIRTKLFLKVYVAGLYLEKKSSDASAIVQSDSTRRIVMQFTRTVDGTEMGEAFADGLKANAPDKAATLKAQIDQFRNALETLKSGEQLAVTYIPGTGTIVSVRGKDKTTIPGVPFGQLIFAMWLGPKPPNADLKTGLLGK